MPSSDYVLYLMPGQEKTVARSLLAQPGIRCYCPLWFELKRPRHAKLLKHHYVVATRPLFPGYLFVGFETEPRWDVVQLTQGVLGIISAHGAPLPINEVELNKVRKLEEEVRLENIGKYTTEPQSIRLEDLRPGQVVEITSGFMVGQRVPVVSASSASEITVMGVLFGRDTPLKLHLQDLRLVK